VVKDWLLFAGRPVLVDVGNEPSLAIGDAFPHEIRDGRVAEWFKAPVLKTGVPARVPWVRIPPLPPRSLRVRFGAASRDEAQGEAGAAP
jgi:hypothetical protein